MNEVVCSIVICTYNRLDKLESCLISLTQDMTATEDRLEVLVVDNSHSPVARDVVARFRDKIKHLNFVHEPKKGLSCARNKGIREAKGDYLFFLDDDAWVELGFCNRLLNTIKEENFDAFGAFVEGHLPEDSPNWVDASYYHPKPFLPERGILKNGYLQGGASAYKKKVLELLGGFSTGLGMEGTAMAYGEDTELEKRMRERGLIIGFDPQLVVHHEVRYNNLYMIILSHYRRSRTFYDLYPERAVGQVVRSTLSCAWQSVVAVFKGLQFLFTRKGYAFQNLITDTCFPLLRAWAIIQVGGPQYFRQRAYFFRRDGRAFSQIMRLLNEKFANLQFVRIGACDGISFDPVHSWTEKFKWQGVLVEPLPHLIHELSENYNHMPGIRIAPVAIADRDGRRKITYVDGRATNVQKWVKGIGTLCPERNVMNAHFHQNNQWKEHIRSAEVETLSWKSFCGGYGIARIDLLVLDVEGMEYKILNQVDVLPDAVVFEFVNLPVNEIEDLKERFKSERGGYFMLQFNDTDVVAVRRKLVGMKLRLRLNLPLTDLT